MDMLPCGIPTYESLMKNSKPRAKTSLVAGALMRGTIRNFLNKCVFNELDITFIESKGFLESEFTIRGDAKDVGDVIHSIRRWAN